MAIPSPESQPILKACGFEARAIPNKCGPHRFDRGILTLKQEPYTGDHHT
jgi:hypothetical protein